MHRKAGVSYIFMPPLPRFSGGMAVLLRVAEHLHRAGLPVRLVLREATSALPPLSVPVLHWEELRLTPEDIWLVPEGWPNALLPGLQAQARCVLYVQNWAFLLGNMPGGDQGWGKLVQSGAVTLLAVSDPVAWFLEQLTGVKPEILRPAIDPALFHPGPPEAKSPPNRLRIAWMPRKNKALARQIRCMVEARNRLPVPLDWVEIHDLPPEGVAERLRSSHIFLATGFPEGCSLPPLEALASGCVVAGFSGLGGWDYMRQCCEFPGACVPWWPLRSVDFAGNGLYAADADVPAAAMALEAAGNLILASTPALTTQREAARATAAAYSPEAQAARVLELWQSWGFIPFF